MSSPPAKRMRSRIGLKKTTNVDKETLNASKTAPNTKVKSTISGRKKNSTLSGASVIDDSLTTSRKQKKTKALNKQEREKLLSQLDSVDLTILREEVCTKLEEEFIPEYLQEMTTKLCKDEQLLETIIVVHRHYFSSLYQECQKGSESFLRLQLAWHKYCSAFLLSRQYSLCDINLVESKCGKLVEARDEWLKFCEDFGIAVPESNPIMLTVSSAIYHHILDFVTSLHNAPITENPEVDADLEMDGDDVYYCFGGAAISDMLHLRYKQIRSCRDDQRDVLSHEISILHCINLKDKSHIPDYLKYRDQGYMYFPHPAFLPLLREVDTSVKGVVNVDGLQRGDDLIKLAHENINSHTRFCKMFRETLISRLPCDITTYNEEAIENVYNTFVRKFCNTRIQEFLSATKQHLATKKGLASTVDVNLRTTLLAHHSKLEAKLGLKE